ncbi:MAG: aspartate kinase [Deltaproteobacteria bacterium]|jgi:aspartate kinase|nr:aspartate kinase [Deltaproteobacteria bacterium]MBT6492533.1 aspartate kinase [Deltaproteobacteria bacterium]
MAIIVQKYGGSSVADVDKLHAVAQSVAKRVAAGDRIVVVVSAMGKTTDQLLAQAALVTQNPPQRELDMLVTAGERISMALLSMAMHKAGVNSISFTGSQSGIITENSHQGARIIEVRPYRIQEALEAGKVVIVAGFQGVSLEREITTLGRGGSDTTAVAMAAALEAEACEIYSDVDGVYDADPNVCPQATLLSEIDYETMQHMAAAGARVLNAQAVEFARKAGIQILARKTADTSGRQTRISADAKVEVGHVTAVVGAPDASLMHGPIQDVSSLLEDVERLGATVLAMATTQSGVLLVNRAQIPGKEHRGLEAVALAHGIRAEEVCALTLVGAGLMAVVSQVLGQLNDAKIVHTMLGASDGAIALVVASESLDQALEMLHANFRLG